MSISKAIWSPWKNKARWFVALPCRISHMHFVGHFKRYTFYMLLFSILIFCCKYFHVNLVTSFVKYLCKSNCLCLNTYNFYMHICLTQMNGIEWNMLVFFCWNVKSLWQVTHLCKKKTVSIMDDQSYLQNGSMCKILQYTNYVDDTLPILIQRKNECDHHNLPIGINIWFSKAKKNFRHRQHTSVQVTHSQKFYVTATLISKLAANSYDVIPFSLALVQKHEIQAIQPPPSSTSELAGY